MPVENHWIKIIQLLSQLVVFDSYNFEEFLKKLIKVITNIVHVDSCFIYFYDREQKQLILIASKKTHKNILGRITLKRGEGITGWVATHQKPVILSQKAYSDERFKPFKELPEDLYEAFLSVPIINKDGVVGVINLQNRKPYLFTEAEVQTLEAIVQIVTAAFTKVMLERRIGALETKLEERKIIEKAKGVLMREKQLSENDAFQLIRKEAMKKRKTIKEIAEAILLIWD